MDDNDPITQFFPGEEDVDLYLVLSLEKSASVDSIKKAYRRLALVYHPDKHATASEDAKLNASTKFQQVGFAYAVLSDDKRKARYDSTGRTDENFDLGAGDDGWEAYFEELFDRVTRGKLDEMKREYQGTNDEIEDIKTAYKMANGLFDVLMTYIPHSTYHDEERFVAIINDLIEKGDLNETKEWLSTSKDEKAKSSRKNEAEKEAKEAEKLAREIGVWDEFYGTGKATDRKKGEGKEANKRKHDRANTEDEDYSALQALISKKKNNMDSFFDNLASKYSEPDPKAKGKKRGLNTNDVERSEKKMRSTPPEIDEEEFIKLQAKLFGNKEPSLASPVRKRGKGRKAK